MNLLSRFRSALELLNSSDPNTEEFLVTVDRIPVHVFVAVPQTTSESEPLLNCLVDGKIVDFRLSAFNSRCEPSFDQGAFVLLDDDDVVHGIRFYRLVPVNHGDIKCRV